MLDSSPETVAPVPHAPAGQLIREWRLRRRMSQLDLASTAGISARHLSFVETGRARPSRTMVLHLAENLDIPAPRAQPACCWRRATHRPIRPPISKHPRWHRCAMRSSGCSPRTTRTPRSSSIGVGSWSARTRRRRYSSTASRPNCSPRPATCCVRVSIRTGLAPRIVNIAQWSAHIIDNVRRQIAVTGDDELRDARTRTGGLRRRHGRRRCRPRPRPPARLPRRCGSAPTPASSR